MQIYKITNKINGKIYIGQDSFDRDDYFGSGKLISRAIKKYGIENFKKEIVEECINRESLNEREMFWISQCNSTDPKIGYNIRLGGEGVAAGSKLSKKHKESIKRGILEKWKDDNFRKKMKFVNKQSIENKSGLYSAETVKKAAISRRGFKHTEETIILFRKQRKGKFSGNKNPMKGRSFHDIWVEKYGKEEADRRKKEVYLKRKTSRKSPYDIWVEKYGKEEADRKMKQREILRQESFRKTQEKKKQSK